MLGFAQVALTGSVASGIQRRADSARDAGDFREAAVLYAEVARLRPRRVAVLVQCGHMYKEAGALETAERYYKRALELTPDDPDLSLQLGHFFKVAGQLDQAATAYQRAIDLKLGSNDAVRELAALRQRGHGAGLAIAAGEVSRPATMTAEAQRLRALALEYNRIAPELAPRTSRAVATSFRPTVEMRHLGRGERSPWGMLRTLRGVEAMRGFCIALHPIAEMHVLLDGKIIVRHPLRDGTPLFDEAGVATLGKYAFNIWFDFSGIPTGRHNLDFRFEDEAGTVQVKHEFVMVAPPYEPGDHLASDGLVRIDPADQRPIDEQVNSQPSMVRPAVRNLFPHPPKTILVQRADQLGDMVCSIPGISRLREVFPEARLIGLLSPANAELAATLNIFDEILVVDFPDDPIERRRVMPLGEQVKLRERLEHYRFDLAIDLSDSGVSRPLLFLSGARFYYGFRHGEFSWLSAGFEGVTRDPVNGLENVPHTDKVLGLIEWLNIISRSHARVVPRQGLSRTMLDPLGLAETDRYAVLHSGARLAFSRWPKYGDLAAEILAKTPLKVVLISDNPAELASMAESVRTSPRLIVMTKRLSFDEFDALLTFSSVFVGNDSGPKHLASLRGARVVSIHMARNNWNEWGQENGGFIISRKVPCAGCSIHHEPDECGKDFACISRISVDEVFGAVNEAMR